MSNSGFNRNLKSILPEPLQRFLETDLPATVCAITTDEELRGLSGAMTQSTYLQSQGSHFDLESIEAVNESDKTKGHYQATNCSCRGLLLDRISWEKCSEDGNTRMARASSFLAGDKCEKLRLLHAKDMSSNTTPRRSNPDASSFQAPIDVQNSPASPVGDTRPARALSLPGNLLVPILWLVALLLPFLKFYLLRDTTQRRFGIPYCAYGIRGSLSLSLASLDSDTLVRKWMCQ
ncbi:hypothetical protein BDV95DRAFT_648179 [Massariosphaeria phaeospora]|uniref:Uncharacterized protein n=1 Tax=Massariosphaeria phaeospora TaxID=100035 RepID=A0A7C8HZT5_9PLEO|nr:hypothetical protein BDV95DRAFT_648179 [Massariosphaeria phaeospora]